MCRSEFLNELPQQDRSGLLKTRRSRVEPQGSDQNFLSTPLSSKRRDRLTSMNCSGFAADALGFEAAKISRIVFTPLAVGRMLGLCTSLLSASFFARML